MAYLPQSHTMTVWHLRDLAQGKKTIIKSNNVKVYNVPQFEGLTIADFLGFAKVYPVVARALPPENEILKLPRQYVINVIYTLIGVPFEVWVGKQIAVRNQRLLEEQNKIIEMDPDVLAIFQASSHISSTKGTGSHLMKASAKRRRSKKQIEDERLEAATKDAEIQRKLARIDELEAAHEQMTI